MRTILLEWHILDLFSKLMGKFNSESVSRSNPNQSSSGRIRIHISGFNFHKGIFIINADCSRYMKCPIRVLNKVIP